MYYKMRVNSKSMTH